MAQPEDTPTEDDTTDEPTDDPTDDRPSVQDELEGAVADDDEWAYGFRGGTDDDADADAESDDAPAAPGVAKGRAWQGHDWDSYADAHEEQQKSEKDLLRELRDELRALRGEIAGRNRPTQDRPDMSKSVQGKPAAPAADLDDGDVARLADVVGTTPDALAQAIDAAGGLAALSVGDFPDDADPDAEAVEEVADAAADEKADSLLTGLDVSHVSGVAEPAVESRWLEVKDTADGVDWHVHAPLLSPVEKAAEEERVSLAPVLRPGQTDRQGDRVTRQDIREAAHSYANAQGVDTDHSLVDEGQMVESYIVRDGPAEFDLPGGGTETVEEGTWLVGIKWDEEAWKRVKDGDLTGLSLYGEADVVNLSSAGGGAGRTPNRRATWEDPNADVARAAADAAEHAVKSVLGQAPGEGDGSSQRSHSGEQDDREVKRKHIHEPGSAARPEPAKTAVDSWSEDELRDHLPDRW